MQVFQTLSRYSLVDFGFLDCVYFIRYVTDLEISKRWLRKGI